MIPETETCPDCGGKAVLLGRAVVSLNGATRIYYKCLHCDLWFVPRKVP